MKYLIIIFSLSLSTIIAQSVDPNKPTTAHPAEKHTANRTTKEILSHIKAIFVASSVATDEEQAQNAAKSINENTEKIIELTQYLKSAERPSSEDKQEFAVEMLKFEVETAEIFQKMAKTFQNNPEEINKLIEPPMSETKKRIAPTMTLINDYYPAEEMLGYINTLKKNK